MKTRIIYIASMVVSVLVTILSFLAEPENRWVFYLILGLVIIGCIAYGIYYYIKKKKQKSGQNAEQYVLLQQDKDIINTLFKLSLDAISKKTNYKTPLYLMLGTEYNDESIILTNNGFSSVLDQKSVITVNDVDIGNESDSYLKFWHSEKGIVIQLGHRIFDEEGVDQELWKEFIGRLCKFRPQQACTGIIYTLGCDVIQTGDQDYHAKIMGGIREAILSLNKYVGVEVPLFLALSKADCIRDFVPFFKVFEEQNNEKPLGFTVKNKERNNFDFEDYQLKTREIVEYFSNSSLKFVKNISDEETRSVLSFPYELALFFNLLENNIRILTKENKFKKVVWLRGLFFLVVNQQDTKYDLLSQLIANKADFDTEAKVVDKYYDKKRLFVYRFFDDVIYPASLITGVNSKQKFKYIFTYVFKILASVFIFFALILSYYDNWMEYLKIRDNLQNVVSNYQANVSNLKIDDTRSMDDVVVALGALRAEKENLHKKLSTVNIVSFEKMSLAPIFDNFYEEQLQIVLLRKLEGMVRESLYNMENMNDTDLLSKGASSYMMLFDKSILDEDYLTDYLDNNVLPAYNIDINLQDSLKLLISDLYKTPYDKSGLMEDKTLVQSFDQQLDAISTEEMLYNIIKLKARNTNKVNMLKSFGPNFGAIFRFTANYDGYNVPFMFTKDGFLAQDISPRSAEFRGYLKNLKIIKPNIELSDDAVVNIAHKVQRLYYSDYIDYWYDLLDHIEVIDLNGYEQIVDSLDRMTNTKNGALESVLKTVVIHTNLTKVYDIEEQKAKAQKQSDSDVMNKVESANNYAKDMLGVNVADKLDGSLISAEFVDLFNFVGVNDQMEYSTDPNVPFVVLLKKLSSINSTLKQLNKNPSSRSKLIFDFLIKNLREDDSDFQLLSMTDDETPAMLIATLSSVQSDVHDIIISNVLEYVSSNWNRQVYSFYKKELESKFPFDADSTNEVNLSKLDSFLSHDGMIDDFFKKYLSPFIHKNTEGYYEPTDSQLYTIDIPQSLIDKLYIIDEIQSVLYVDNPKSASVKLRLVPRKLSRKATQFEYNDGTNICTYDQGPRQPCVVSWPTNSLNKTNFKFTAMNSYGYGHSYNTSWGIFRALMDKQHSDLSNVLQQGAQQWTYNVDDYQMIYDIQIVGADGVILPLYLFEKLNIRTW